MTYRDADLSFEAPDGWTEPRVFAGFSRSADIGAPSILVARTATEPGESTHMYVQRKLLTLSVIEKFRLLESAEVTFAGLPGTRVRYSHETNGEIYEDSETFVFAPGDKDIVTSFYTSMRRADIVAARPLLEAALASVRFAAPASSRAANNGVVPLPSSVPIPGVRDPKP